MNLKFLVVLILALGAVSASSAQALQKVKWKAYGVQFNAPVGFVYARHEHYLTGASPE